MAISLIARKLIARVLFGALPDYARKRKRMAWKWLSGKGLEIGALHNPLSVPGNAEVTYVDRMSNSDLLDHYPELRGKPLVPVAIVDDGESLATVSDASQEFLVANHLMEHCESPIGALQTWLRVLKPGGIAFITVPDKRFTFDFRRDGTTWQHVADDYRYGPERSRKAHYDEWVCNVMGEEADAEAKAAQLHADRYSIHFHTWSAKSLEDFFRKCRSELGFPYELRELVRNGGEVIVILQKNASAPG